jgi:hypothetical protein
VSEPSSRAPLPLLVGAGLVVLEGLAMLALAVLEALSLSTRRVELGVTTTIFFAALGLALLLCARGLALLRSWARSPVVVTQLILLLTAWSFRGGETTVVAVVMAAVSVVVLIGVLHPASTRALAADPT